MNELPPESRWKPYVANIGTGSLIFAVAPAVPTAFRIGFGVTALVCVIIDSQWLRRRLKTIVRTVYEFVRQFWWLLLVLGAITGTGGAVWRHFGTRSIPRSVVDARTNVLQIQRSLTGKNIRILWVLSKDSWPTDRVYARGWEPIVVEHRADPSRLKTYLSKGNVVAEDVPGTPSGFIRRYYRGKCIFASDYFDSEGGFVLLEYDEKCDGKLVVIGSESPSFFPPFPVFSYH